MNIFCTNPDPLKCARDLDDSRLNKMILESGMMLSDYLHRTAFPYKDRISYPNRQKNNPWLLWTSRTHSNYDWMLEYFLRLNEEYIYRKQKFHAWSNRYELFCLGLNYIPKGPLTPFINQARKPTKNIDYTHLDDIHFAYKLYLIAKWHSDIRIPTWTLRGQPDWIESVEIMWEGIQLV